MPPLTKVKQEKFCLNYIKMGNAAKAAIVAGYAPKYARNNVPKLLQNTKIQNRLAELQKKLEDESIAKPFERKQILTEILRTKLTDFMELGKDGSWVNIGPETEHGGAIQEIHSRTEYDENGEHPTIYTSVKLHDPVRAIDLLNKMERIYDDAPRVNVNLDQRQVIIQVIDTETQNLLARVQNGESPDNVETDKNLQAERGGLPPG